jgi:hypothetical protein
MKSIRFPLRYPLNIVFTSLIVANIAGFVWIGITFHRYTNSAQIYHLHKASLVRSSQTADKYRRLERILIGKSQTLGTHGDDEWITILDKKFKDAGILEDVQEIMPVGNEGTSDVIIQKIKVRIASCPVEKLGTVFQEIEYSIPLVTIANLSMERVSMNSTDLNIEMELMLAYLKRDQGITDP